MDWLNVGIFIPNYLHSEQILTDLWSTVTTWGSSAPKNFTIIDHKVAAPVIMLENILDFINYGLTATGIICLGIVCYCVMYEVDSRHHFGTLCSGISTTKSATVSIAASVASCVETYARTICDE